MHNAIENKYARNHPCDVLLTNHPGYCEVRLAIMDDQGNAKVLTFGDRFRVKRDTSLFAEIKILFGPSSLPMA